MHTKAVYPLISEAILDLLKINESYFPLQQALIRLIRSVNLNSFNLLKLMVNIPIKKIVY